MLITKTNIAELLIFANLMNIFYMSNDSKSVVMVSDASIKNNIAMFISHIHSPSNPIKKTICYAVNITSTEAELFAIRCGIN